MRPPKGFRWEQEDALKLKCEECGKIVNAECVDLHICKGDSSEKM